jgi:hypothetical protein
MDGHFWFVDALTELKQPYSLELSIRKTAGASYRRYACRLEQAAIVHLFEHHCMDPFGTPNKYPPDHLGNYPVLENTMLQVRFLCRGASSI